MKLAARLAAARKAARKAAMMAASVPGGCAGPEYSPLVAQGVRRTVCGHCMSGRVCGLVVTCMSRVDVGVLTCCVGHLLTEHGLFLRELV